MIPIRDSQPRRHLPIVTYLLIGLNIFVFFVELGQGPQLDAFLREWGAVPARLASWTEQPSVLTTLVTSMFLHGGWMHLIGNMLFLVIFGDNIEDRLGRIPYLAFYLTGGIVAGVTQSYLTPGSSLPAIGASGAVAAVLGAYMIMYPRSQVTMLFPLFFWFSLITVPAYLALGMWFVSQFFNGIFALQDAEAIYAGGVAWWAHIGGFIIGILVGLPLRRRRGTQRAGASGWPNQFG